MAVGALVGAWVGVSVGVDEGPGVVGVDEGCGVVGFGVVGLTVGLVVGKPAVGAAFTQKRFLRNLIQV